MTNYIRRLGAPLALSTVLAFAACKGSERKADTTLATDATLGSDLALAGRDTTAQPALKDVPATPAWHVDTGARARATLAHPHAAPDAHSAIRQ